MYLTVCRNAFCMKAILQLFCFNYDKWLENKFNKVQFWLCCPTKEGA